MQATLDLHDDLPRIADGVQDVALERRDTREQFPVEGALRGAIDRREAAPSDGKYAAADVVWHLPAREQGVVPALGDRIIELTGARWTVLSVELAALGAKWRCRTRNLAIAAGLDSAITLQRALHRKDAAGAAVPFWIAEQTGLPARIQPQELQEHGERRQAAVRHVKIFLGEVIAVEPGDRAIGPDGAVYLVTQVIRAERIDELVTLSAERLVDRVEAAAVTM